jgi:hypothetical protein
VAKKCLEIIKTYRRGSGTPLSKSAVIQDVTATLTSTTYQFTETEINDALGSYLKIINQCDRSIEAASDQNNAGAVGTGTLDRPSVAFKQALSPEPVP